MHLFSIINPSEIIDIIASKRAELRQKSLPVNKLEICCEKIISEVEDVKCYLKMEIEKSDKIKSYNLEYLGCTLLSGDVIYLYRFNRQKEGKSGYYFTRSSRKGENVRWIYFNCWERKTRIFSGERHYSFLDSDLTYEDLVSTPGDFRHDLQTQSKTNFCIETFPVSNKIAEEVGFTLKKITLSKKEIKPQKIEYYNQVGSRKKILNISSLNKVNSHLYVPERFKISRMHKSNKSSTEVFLQDIKINTGLKKEDFFEGGLPKNN